MSGFVQFLEINSRNGHEMGHQSSACPQQFQRTKKTHSRLAAIRKQRAFDREVQSWAKFKRVDSRLEKKSIRKSTSTHVLLPAMSSIALETRAVHSRKLDLSGFWLLRMRSRRVLVGLRFKIS